MLIELVVQSLTRLGGNLERSTVSHKLHDITCSIQNCTAMATILKVGGHAGTETRFYLVVKIVGNLPPYFFAVNFDGPFGQAVPPFLSCVLKCGTRTLSKEKSPLCLTQQPQKGDKDFLRLGRLKTVQLRSQQPSDDAWLSIVFSSRNVAPEAQVSFPALPRPLWVASAGERPHCQNKSQSSTSR